MAWLGSYSHCGQEDVGPQLARYTTPHHILELVHKNREYGRTGPQRKKIKYFVLHLFGGDLSDEIEGYRDSVSSHPLFS